MSGGAGPPGDTSLPKDHQPPQQQPLTPPSETVPKPANRGSLTLRQLNSLAIMLVLAASGMVSLQHIALVLFSVAYIFFLSKFAFPTQPGTQARPVFNQSSRVLNLYILFAAIIGLLLPILYIFAGILEGDTEGTKAAVPHLFLLTSQVFMEGVSVSGRFSLPIRVFVPVFYNSVRMFAVFDWVKDEFNGGCSRRVVVGRGLAVANLGLWSFNLLGFLLPVYLPKAMQIYYGGVATSSSKKD